MMSCVGAKNLSPIDTNLENLMKQRAAEKQESPAKCNDAVCKESNSAGRQERIRDILYASSAKGKLKFGSSGDPSEQQADSAAAGYMSGGKNTPFQTSPVSSSSGINLGFEQNGSSLSGSQRQGYESYYGQSLADVRMHTGSEAAEAANAVNAKAFSVGRDIYFGQGQYSPNTESGQSMLTHEVAHTMQADSGNTLRKWGASEHRRYGNVAGQKLVQHKSTLLEGLKKTNSKAKGEHSGLDYGKEYSIEFRHEEEVEVDSDDETTQYETVVTPTKRKLGWATKNAGDHSRTAQDMDKDQYGAEGATAIISPYIALAQTNWNHFFPLAECEWEANHKTAKGYAEAANRELKDNELGKAKDSMHNALVHEAFALHFLQDTFASGHQYPRAFDSVFDGPSFRSKTYHDILCDLETGIDMRYSRNTSHKFRGDGTGTDKCAEIVGGESYNSIAEIYAIATGVEPSAIGAEKPMPNPGPNIPKIMKDPVAGPIWYAMETDMDKFIDGDVENEEVSTSSRKVTRTQVEIKNAWRAAHKDEDGKELTTKQTLALGKKNDPEEQKIYEKTCKFYEKVLHDPGFLKTDVDDDIMTFLTNDDGKIDVSRINALYLPYSALKHIIESLLNKPTDNWYDLFEEKAFDGLCMDDEEVAVIAILYYQYDDVCQRLIKDISMDVFDNSIQGENWDFFLYMYTLKSDPANNAGANWIIKDNDDVAARWLTKIGQWRGLLVQPIPYYNLTKEKWVAIIRVLLDGNCDDDDEDAIVYIVRQMILNLDGEYLGGEISKDEMDDGVDWGQWDTISAWMQKYW